MALLAGLLPGLIPQRRAAGRIEAPGLARWVGVLVGCVAASCPSWRRPITSRRFTRLTGSGGCSSSASSELSYSPCYTQTAEVDFYSPAAIPGTRLLLFTSSRSLSLTVILALKTLTATLDKSVSLECAYAEFASLE